MALSINKSLDMRRKYKEVFISLNSKVSKVYGVEVSPIEYMTYTTEETEKLEVSQRIEENGGNVQQALISSVA